MKISRHFDLWYETWQTTQGHDLSKNSIRAFLDKIENCRLNNIHGDNSQSQTLNEENLNVLKNMILFDISNAGIGWVVGSIIRCKRSPSCPTRVVQSPKKTIR
jgi:hypothetical protein